MDRITDLALLKDKSEEKVGQSGRMWIFILFTFGLYLLIQQKFNIRKQMINGSYDVSLDRKDRLVCQPNQAAIPEL